MLGFYFDEQSCQVVGIAEYESRERLAEIQASCENDVAFPDIARRAKELVTSFDEKILDKLDLDEGKGDESNDEP